MPNGLTISRFGLSVGKRVSKKAVIRNRLKRRLREILRKAPINPGWDVVFIVQPAAVSVDYGHLKASVEDLLSLSNIMEADEERESTRGTVTLDGRRTML